MPEVSAPELERPLSNEEPIGIAMRKPTARPLHDLPGVILPYLDIACERNRIYPCLSKSPLPADFMIRLATCDCESDEGEPDFDDVQASCATCLEVLLEQKEAACMGCGTRWVPGHELVQDIVRIRWVD